MGVCVCVLSLTMSPAGPSLVHRRGGHQSSLAGVCSATVPTLVILDRYSLFVCLSCLGGLTPPSSLQGGDLLEHQAELFCRRDPWAVPPER